MRTLRSTLAGFATLTLLGACTQVLGIGGDYQGLDDDGAGGSTTGTPAGTETGTATGTATGTTGNLGDSCSGNGDCASGNCADDVCCDTGCNGTCEGCVESLTGEPDGTCGALPDGTPSSCPGNQACYGGDCSLRPNGEPCTSNGQCQATCGSEDVCCDANCGGDCESCLAANTGQAEGTCAPITMGTDPKMACPMNQTCDGMGACN